MHSLQITQCLALVVKRSIKIIILQKIILKNIFYSFHHMPLNLQGTIEIKNSAKELLPDWSRHFYD